MQKPKRIMIDHETGQPIKMPKVTTRLIKDNINNGPALYNLGTFELQNSNWDSALTCLKAAWAAEKTKETLLNLATAYKGVLNFKRARECLEECIAKYPTFPLAYNNLGLIEYDDNNFIRAKELYRKALSLDGNYADAHWNLALALGIDYFGIPSIGDVKEVMDEYQWRFRKTSPVNINVTIGTSEWRGESLDGKKLLILCEQGLGDMIQFLRYAYTFSPESVIIHLPEDLHCLVRKEYTCTNVSTVPHDYWVPMCSLLRFVPLGSGVSYIDSVPSPLKGGIGIVWKGNPKHQNDRNRSMLLRDFSWLRNYGTVYSLQKDVEIPKSMKDIHKISLNSWADTRAAISGLDLVVTVDTSVAHLAGAMGKRTIMLVPSNGIDWRWGCDNERTIWYDSMTLVRNRDMKRAEEIVSSIS